MLQFNIKVVRIKINKRKTIEDSYHMKNKKWIRKMDRASDKTRNFEHQTKSKEVEVHREEQHWTKQAVWSTKPILKTIGVQQYPTSAAAPPTSQKELRAEAANSTIEFQMGK